MQIRLDKADAEERETKMLSGSIGADGKFNKMPMRQRTPESEINITLSESRRDLENYLPKKLSGQELQSEIDAAKKMANERLAEEQKAASGNMANDMVEKLLKKNNESQIILGVGEAAF